MKLKVTALVLALFSATWSAPAFGQANFYEGKTIRFIVGFTAGGGYDLYTRTLGRHLGKHIAGNPTIIVDNMPGAGSMISANYTFKAAKPDGLTVGHFIGGLFSATDSRQTRHRVRRRPIRIRRRAGAGQFYHRRP